MATDLAATSGPGPEETSKLLRKKAPWIETAARARESRAASNETPAAMTPQHAIAFGPFVVDLDGELLLRDVRPIPRRPNTWAVLRYLVERPCNLVTKDELLDGIWPDVTVGDELPGVSVKELRTALGDDARAPRFIATIHRRGYRFIGSIVPSAPDTRGAPRARIVGRDGELDRLAAWLERARAGE